MKLNADELRKFDESQTLELPPRLPFYLIIDDVWDTYNIGGLFRLADALAFEKIFICGQSETPPNHRIKKASIGTYKVVPWEYRESALETIKELRGEDRVIGGGGEEEGMKGKPRKIQIVAIEQAKDSISYTKIEYSFPLALIVGNETHGVSHEALEAADHIAEIPLFGVNKSLNVIVSGAIVAFEAYNTVYG
ncbi:hypothetical protein A3D80_02085 [Candidatus Roizmanbacteria bacterium RIFCSPHIGHO2_02_FULL_40_13b]|uniref:tRNA/rRNA methyltransferase SpoU type domain-containing protein n=1 Tax=Candidatus Roizmanbacteria bacterium RIFCSPHIGHO2_01_FULL_39_24 TaxID=1802032 RepID=A0A1F7GGN8_9BACT|nr:MAG: hypothetical protein A2799_04755 [Candidatus Roizmanbacteria bacterium RIFCSPHIGHO2_01_FULL_39_24]OGK26624.1 MAG: hypothetical protein A3D80_02085 [Candidatus Roizmanbacteria bacterium RIFCSPHIGHO2_02_FULL_40_13b]